ncbi:Putative acid--amine ligase YjfC [Sporomusa rhizae]|uniref:glutathionylspermidine synthase family protein n=1 Tax=Sporomusa rhizae TaxID=357999 RepID=UPI003529D731
MTYQKVREAIYTPLRDEGIFTWDLMYGSEYALAAIHSISQGDKTELAYATEQLGGIFAKTATAIQRMDMPIFRELGIPEVVINASRIHVLGAPTLIGRFDFARTKRGWKMLEFNSDTPGGIVEAFYVNGQVCAYYGKEDPNRGMNIGIKRAFAEITERYQVLGYPTARVVFSALDWHSEDAGTTRYLLQQSGLNADFVPLKDLHVYQDKLCALCDGDFRPIDLLYRLHPLGMLGEDVDTDGFPTGEYVLRLVERRKLGLINPAAAIISQTKSLQALIWNLHVIDDFFTSEEQEIIAAYMLPTYYENVFLGQADYVAKPILGREGGNVQLYHADGELLEEEQEGWFSKQMVVYQQMVDLELITVPVAGGLYSGRLLWGSFIINGKASAIMARVGGRITNDMSYFLPVGME